MKISVHIDHIKIPSNFLVNVIFYVLPITIRPHIFYRTSHTENQICFDAFSKHEYWELFDPRSLSRTLHNVTYTFFAHNEADEDVFCVSIDNFFCKKFSHNLHICILFYLLQNAYNNVFINYTQIRIFYRIDYTVNYFFLFSTKEFIS